MNKMSVIKRDKVSYLKVHVKKNRKTDIKALDWFVKQTVPALIAPNKKGSVFWYDISEFIPLSKFLKSRRGKIDKTMWRQIVGSFADTFHRVRTIQPKMFEEDNIVLDLNYVYINDRTYDVKFIYIPIQNLESPKKLKNFCEDLIKRTKFVKTEDLEFKHDFENIISRESSLSTSELIKYSDRLCATVERAVISESVSVAETFKECTQLKKVVNPETDCNSCSHKYDGTVSIFNSNKFSCVYLNTIEKTEDMPIVTAAEDSDKTELLTVTPYEPPVSVPIPSAAVNYKLVFVYKDKQIVIDKDVFIIGKEVAKCNFSVRNNEEVSRTHLRITTDNSHYFAEDMSSSNGTLINGNRISANIKHKLQANDVITLVPENPETFVVKICIL